MAAELEISAPLSFEELARIDAYWRACNYLSVGMIYLRENPLLRELPRTRKAARSHHNGRYKLGRCRPVLGDCDSWGEMNSERTPAHLLIREKMNETSSTQERSTPANDVRN